MQIRIEPRKRIDGSGILMMPLRKNVPLPRDPDWKLTICPGCGRKCWDRPLPAGHRVERKLCTECALRRAEADAEVKRIQAEAEAEQTCIEAEAEADANNMLNNSITENLIKMKEAEARMEHGWVTVQGASAVVQGE